MLEMSGETATVMININLKGRQLDLVVGTDHLTLVLEAKASTVPLRGTTNGPWTAHTRSGRSRTTGNAYAQALSEKNALCDALREFLGEVEGYPDAHVVFVPELAAGSQLSFDFKVTHGGIDGLATQLAKRTELRCTTDQWRAFAARHSLEQVFDLASALDPRSLDAQRTLARYIAAFTATYASAAAEYKADLYDVDGELVDLTFLEYLLQEARTDLLIQGPSGCGKSLLSMVLANRLCAKDVIPIIVEGKLFEGQLGLALDREAALLDVTSAKKLLAAVRTLSRPIAIIVDGYNECPSGLRFKLIRALRAASIMYDAAIVVSSQIETDRPDLLPLRKVTTSVPSHDLKVEIASLDAASAELLAPLLQTIASGIEASLVGQMGREVNQVASRSALFDGFVRRRLGASASEGVTLLCCVAELLFERMTFSLSTREVDRILVRERLGAEVLQEVLRARLLILRGERLSFVHEMYLNAFAAEAIVRQVDSDFDALARALASPRFNELRAFVVGAIEDMELLARLLSATTDAQLLRASMKGECGSDAKRFVTQDLNAVMGRLRSEVETIRFFIAPDQHWQIGVEPASCILWTEHERAMLSALPAALALDQYSLELLDVFRLLDKRLNEERARLQSEAIEKGFKLLRTSLFAVAYVFGQRDLGVSLVMSVLHGSLERSSLHSERQATLRDVWLNVATPGQFYFALALSRETYRLERDILNLAIDQTLPMFEIERWKYLPYHVQLDLMHFVHFLPRDDSAQQERLSKALESLLPVLNPVLQSTALEALSGLGAMDGEVMGHEAQVRLQVAEVLSDPGVEGAAEIAWEVYSGQFDHPFDSAYINVVEGLSNEHRLTLMRLACMGASEYSFFVGSLMDNLASEGDALAVPAISRWARLPDPTTSIRQNAVEIYISALMALGKLQSDLPAESCPMGLGPREDAMSACGLIYYWLQRRTCEAAEAEPPVVAALEALSVNPSRAIGVLSEISQSIIGHDPRGTLLVTAFPARMVMLARAALQRGGPMEGYFSGPHSFGRSDAERFAISMIGSYGGAEDLPLLRTFVDQVDLSGSARKALAAIETRASFAAQGNH
ncbi:ATP-binding protein [Pseudomonas fluorescens]|uniref:ATP-binding protein n=1 Tax=Pseudomonas fluorescens TaxID=294 RepID=UPI001783E390|nr:ATP-binding protein [Pseudomonas fluorescens]